MIKKEDIQSTNAYKKATKAQKRLLLGRTQKHQIRRSIKRVKALGVRKWIDQTTASSYSQNVVLELYSLKLKVNV